MEIGIIGVIAFLIIKYLVLYLIFGVPSDKD